MAQGFGDMELVEVVASEDIAGKLAGLFSGIESDDGESLCDEDALEDFYSFVEYGRQHAEA